MIKFPGLKLGPDPSAQSRTLSILQKRHIVATEFYLLNVSKYMLTLESHCLLVLGLVVLHFFFTLFLSLGAGLPVLGPFHMGGAFGYKSGLDVKYVLN